MGLINEWCLPDLEDRIGNNDGGATGSDDGQELDLSKLRTFKDFVSANSDLIDFGDCGNVKSLVMVINLDSTTQSFLQNNVNGVSASSGTLAYTDFDNAFVDGVDTNSITTGWHCVIITSTTDVSCTNLELGHIGATYGDFKCAYLATYSEDLSATQIQRITEEQLYKVNSRDSGATYRYLPPKNSIRDGLVAHFPLNGGSTDISGSGFNGTDTSMSYGTIALNGMATGVFNGSGYISLGNVLSYERNQAWTLSAWIKNETTYSCNVLGKQASSGPYQGYLLGIASGGVFQAGIYGGSILLKNWANNYANDGKWHLITVTYDGSNTLNGINIYTDGLPATVGFTVNAPDSGTIVTTQPLQISGRGGANSLFTGKILDARVYNRALSATEIDKLFRDTFIN